ncbi:MAG: hypothetical protein JXQ71_06490 [Verrucomicrobia bacterium]|nr:hypothetical protein [Verrucomicrobiota bacterium]
MNCIPMVCWLAAGTVAWGDAGRVAAPEAVAPGGGPLAWRRFVEGPETYAGHPYHWLGRGPLELQFDVAPAPGQCLELLWGAKGDQRSAIAQINGATVPLAGGGYDGFRWLRVLLPPGITGTQVNLTLAAAGGRTAFVAEARLVLETGAVASAPAPPGLQAPAHKARVIRAPGTSSAPPGEAFPDMRRIWDRAPAASAGETFGASALARFREAERNARVANEAFYRCRRYVDGWLAHADPVTGLIPRNLTRSRDYWNGRDAAADNYPYMVLTASMTDRDLFEGRLRDMLGTEIRLTSRLGRLTDDYSFSKQGYRRETVDVDAIVFESAEYVKDGLIPITEWLGPSPWSERMIGLMDDLWAHAPVATPHGRIPTLNIEVCGDLLQACSRLFWFTGQRKYLDWALRLGDYFLLGGHHPTRDLDTLRLSDHGCEVVNGLTELYVAVSRAEPERHRAYAGPIHEMLDRILEAGSNEDGLLYTSFQPKTGKHAEALCDTWGYNYDGFYAVYLVDRTPAYREAVRKVLGNLKGKYVGAAWGDKSADGFADSIEGALNLFNRELVPGADEWIESQTRLMWAMQQPDGVIEGWHGDGNVARTSLMVALWKTAGLTAHPWRADLRFGAARDGDQLYLSLAADQPWEGRLVFDQPRHRTFLRLPMDYPRINQFPEWFVVDAAQSYRVRDADGAAPQRHSGLRLQRGLPLRLEAGRERRLIVAPEHAE